MQKIKITIALISALAGLMLTATPVMAANISITQLPAYITSNSFKLSYSCLGCSSVQFYVNKHAEGWVAFGPVMTDASGQAQVTSAEVNDQTDYIFKVADIGGAESVTTTFYDVSGPSPISNYYKERVSDGEYKLHWTNPSDSDFDKVVIYKGEEAGFSADGSHEIARVSGGSNSEMTYEDHFTPDAGKTYFYVIRALDHAGNSSSLAGDAGETTQVLGTSATPASGKVTVLPKEKGTGSVLGSQATPTPSPVAVEEGVTAAKAGVLGWILTHKKISAVVGLVLLAIAYYLYRAKKNS
jgi:predicted phage tail protein